MKNVLFATTAASALLIGGIASAQGVALFGDARLGVGYNIANDGSTLLNDQGDTEDDFRAISRVRFGVNMTGETDSGITFGATIRADNAIGGQGGTVGQTAGSVFVSGSYGTLTMGDTNGADEQWVGDVPGDFTVTGLGDRDETFFISNGGQFGSDGGTFASNPAARPTIRYDFDIAGFGISVSSNRDLDDVVVGAGYSADFGGGSWSIGVGYDKFQGFSVLGAATTTTATVIDANGNPITVVVPVAPITANVPDGEQWSAGLKGDYGPLSFGATWQDATASDGPDEIQTLLVGAAYSFDAFSIGGVYGNYLQADGNFADRDGDYTWEATGQYDLGGGASVNGGFGQDYDENWVGDFGIVMAF